MKGSPPRVLHVDTANEWRGGQVQLLALVRGMVARKWPVQVACPALSPLWKELEFLGEGRVAIPAGNSVRTTWRVRQVQADLLAAHTSHAHTLCSVVDRPLVVHRRVDFAPSGGWKYRRPDAYIAVSEAVAAILKSVGVEEVRVVHDGVDPLSPLPPALDGATVLAVGACVAHKGHNVLAEAAQILSGVDIGVAGEGPLRYPGLRHLGQRSDVAALLAAADVFVHPSLEEGLGQAVIEAMLAGVPVVVSDAGGLPELVGDCGIIVRKGDAAALAQGIARALAGDHPPIARAQERARTAFSVSKMVEGTLRVYEETIARAAKGA